MTATSTNTERQQKENLNRVCATLGCTFTEEALRELFLSRLPGINGGTKKLDDLITEIKKGDCEILEIGDSTIVRKVKVASINIIHGGMMLVEEHKILPTGEYIRRGLLGVSEKIQLWEQPFVGAVRGVAEELEGSQLRKLEKTNFYVETGSKLSQYKGIVSVYHKHMFKAALEEESIKDYYEEESENGTVTKFIWAYGLKYDVKLGRLNYTTVPQILIKSTDFERFKRDYSKDDLLKYIHTNDNYVFTDGLFYMNADHNLVSVE